MRAVHPGGRVLERTVKAEGDDAAVQREAVLLAGNLARDEARELVDALAARPSPPRSEAKVAPHTSAPAQPPGKRGDEGWAPVTVGLFYPLATNLGRPNIRLNMDLSLLYGRVGTVSGAQLGGAVTHASRGVSGTQIAGAVAIANGPVDGAQLSGAANVASGAASGAQITGAANVALEGIAGAQLAGAFNLSRGGGSGAAIAGGANVATRDFTGAQLAGGANVATRDFTGAQIAGVNVAGNIEGAQIGVINVGRKVKGAQIGVINIAEEVDGAAVGVISISRNSIHPIAWTSNLQYMNAGIKFSTKYFFTVVAVHYGTREGDFDNVGTTAAVGGRVPLPAGFDVELQGSLTQLLPRPSQSSKSGNLWVAPQVIGGYSFASHLRVFVGGGARLPATVDLGRDVVRPEVLAGIQF